MNPRTKRSIDRREAATARRRLGRLALATSITALVVAGWAPAIASATSLPVADVSPASLDFGNVAVGSTSDGQLVAVTNTAAAGSDDLHISAVTLVGGNASDFLLIGGNCQFSSVAPGNLCTVEVFFKPTALGVRSAVLRFSDDAANTPQDVSLSGTGVMPIASISPTSIDYGTVAVGTTSDRRTVTITNSGNTTLEITAETITGADASDFAFVSDHCITSFYVAPGASCTIELTFTPGAIGARSATLSITDNASGSPQTVELIGAGGTPIAPSADLALSISATPNPVRPGQKVTYTITVLNAGPSTASSVLINDSLSSQSTFVSATISQGSCVTPARGASGVVSCSFASLTNGASQPVQVVVTVIAKRSSITNTATVSAATADPNLANNTAAITTRVK